MKRLTKLQRLLAGGLVLALGIWAIDALTGKSGRPAHARAASATAAATAPAADWNEVDALVARLTQQRYVSVIPDLDRTPRDLFSPSPAMESLLAPAPPPAPEPNTPALAEEAASDFQSRHQLSGVVIGRNPLAIVDGRVLHRNGELDGYRLVELQRDFVVFQEPRTGARATLKLAPRGTPSPSAP